MSHTSEPWEQVGASVCWRSEDEPGLTIEIAHVQHWLGNADGNARRIVQCVNWCRGIDFEQLDNTAIYCDKCQTENDLAHRAASELFDTGRFRHGVTVFEATELIRRVIGGKTDGFMEAHNKAPTGG